MSANISQATRRWLRLAGAAALVVSGAIHLDLYLTGYRLIATIGPLFFVQSVAAIGLGLTLVFQDRALLSAAGAGFILGTLAGYLLSRTIGIFGFHEVSTPAGIVSEVVELFAFALLVEVAISHHNTRSKIAHSRFVGTTRLVRILVVAIGMLVTLSMIAGANVRSSSVPATATGPSVVNERTITIANFAFVPAHITVTPGEEILIINRDSVAHSVTETTRSGTSLMFNSKNIGPGDRAVIRAPKTPGSYAYFCDIHNFMTGVITVRP
ncbi:MAG TPA: cupredoxin domain-containing protein [Acidimicrobiales bacterium]|nr:cupredoxin domain-containing protein [Acidimicrobiales bacterium]